MIVGVGLDLVDIARWAQNLANIQARIFTARELAACAERADRIDALAARFAAKEACLKALNVGIRQGALGQIEIASNPVSAPRIYLREALGTQAHELGVRHAHVSLTHHEGIAAAVVILEGTRVRPGSHRAPLHSDEPWTLETVMSGAW
jgi:holo-[acyl-carrier protein] synthase